MLHLNVVFWFPPKGKIGEIGNEKGIYIVGITCCDFNIINTVIFNSSGGFESQK